MISNVEKETLEKFILALDIEPVDLFKFPYESNSIKKEELLESIKVLLKGKSLSDLEIIYWIVKDILTMSNSSDIH